MAISPHMKTFQLNIVLQRKIIKYLKINNVNSKYLQSKTNMVHQAKLSQLKQSQQLSHK